MTQEVKKIDFINIDCDSNYFDTKEQISLRSTYHFTDYLKAAKISGSFEVSNLFSEKRTKKDRQLVTGDLYPLSTTVVDASGNDRKILSLDIDIFASSSIDAYKNGVEITQDKHWTAGLAKISAGTPGHLYESFRYGIVDIDVFETLSVANTSSYDNGASPRNFLTSDLIDNNFLDNSGNQRRILTSQKPTSRFTEITTFDPVMFVESGGDPDLYTYPIVTKDANQAENYILNGIIEPLTIRPIISNFSINFPFEPHATRGEFGNGNVDHRFASDSVTSIDYFTPKSNNRSAFLDAVDRMGVASDTAVSASLGVFLGYFLLDENYVPPFEDVVSPRGEKYNAAHGDQLTQALSSFKPQSETYVSNSQKSSVCGFVYDANPTGVDSVAYGDISFGPNRDNRRRKRSIVQLRDSESFVRTDTLFNDTNVIHFVSQSLEYPSMMPTDYTGPMLNSTARSEIYMTGSIKFVGPLKPGNFDYVLTDSILNSKRRLGTL
jgi:hypothetical protein